MNLEEFYTTIDGNYEKIIALFKDESRVKKFLKMLLDDDNFEQLTKAIESKDAETAFRASHTLKGVALNLCLTRFQETISELTENLRDRTFKTDTQELYENVKRENSILIESLKQLE